MDPATGTFTSMDTYGGSLEDPMSLHKYLFANSNPVKYCDPSGHYSIPEQLCIMACIGAIAGSILYVADTIVNDPQMENHSIKGLLETVLCCAIAAMIIVLVYYIYVAVITLIFSFITQTFLSVESSKDANDRIYRGVREASNYLRESGVERRERINILQSFDIKTIHLVVAGDNTFGLRFWGGNASKFGHFLFDVFQPVINRFTLALPPEWNSMENLVQFQIREGTVMIVGNVAPQLSYGDEYYGGAIQLFILFLEDLIECK